MRSSRFDTSHYTLFLRNIMRAIVGQLRQLGVAGITIFAIVTTVQSQDSVEKPAKVVVNTRLPNFYSQIGLLPSQRDSIYAIQQKYGTQIADLIRQVEELRRKQNEEIAGILKPDQRAELKRLMDEAAASRKARAASRLSGSNGNSEAASPKSSASE